MQHFSSGLSLSIFNLLIQIYKLNSIKSATTQLDKLKQTWKESEYPVCHINTIDINYYVITIEFLNLPIEKKKSKHEENLKVLMTKFQILFSTNSLSTYINNWELYWWFSLYEINLMWYFLNLNCATAVYISPYFIFLNFCLSGLTLFSSM